MIIFNSNTAHCVLLGSNYTMKKLVCPEPPLILMIPLPHPVPMAKNHGFLPIGIEGQAKKKLFSTAPSLGCATLNQ